MGKEKKPPLPPYVLQVLTTEYLIEGTLDGDTELYFDGAQPFTLTSVQIQTARPMATPARAAARFSLLGLNVVAFIPLMDVSQMPQSNLWRQYKVPIAGTFFLGPYTMQGSLMVMAEGFFQRDRQMPMLDVHITSPSLDARWSELRAPFALVNTSWLHGYERT